MNEPGKQMGVLSGKARFPLQTGELHVIVKLLHHAPFAALLKKKSTIKYSFYYSMVLLLRQFLIPCVSAKFEPFDDAVCWLNHRTFCFLSALHPSLYHAAFRLIAKASDVRNCLRFSC